MAGELVTQVTRGDLFREQAIGYNPWAYSVLVGSFAGIRLNKLDLDGYTFRARVPSSITMGTGLTFSFDLVDNGEFPNDPGLVVRLGVTVKRLVAGETLSMDTGAGAEQFVNVTTQGTAGNLTIGTLAIALANLDSAVVGDRIGVRVRRNGTNAADTFQGSIILVGLDVTNT